MPVEIRRPRRLDCCSQEGLGEHGTQQDDRVSSPAVESESV